MEWILAALLGGFLAFNSAVTPDKAAQLAQKSLQEKFPSSQVKVEMEGKRGNDVLNGKFKRVRIEINDLNVGELPMSAASGEKPKKIGHAKNVELSLKNAKLGATRVQSADLQFTDLRYDLDALKERSQFSLVGFGSAKLSLALQAAQLQPLLAPKVSGAQNVELSLQNDTLTVSGTRTVLGFPAPFSWSATPVFRGPELMLENQKLLVSGLPVPAHVARQIVGEVKSVYSLSNLGNLPFRVEVKRVLARNQTLQIEADLLAK